MNLQDQINAALKQGVPLSLGNDTYTAVLDLTSDKTSDLVHVAVKDINLPQNPSLHNLAGLFGGNSIASLVPSVALPLDDVTLAIQNVGFVLATKAEKIIQVSAAIGFTGMSWKVITLGQDAITLKLDSIRFVASTPGSNLPFFMATAYGKATIGTQLTLDVTANFPGGSISLIQAPGTSLDMGTFFNSLGLDGMGMMDKVSLSGMNFSIDPKSQSFDLQGGLSPQKESSLELIPNVLAFENMYFSLSHTSEDTRGTINGSLIFGNYLALDASANLNTSDSSWDFSGNINIPQTAKNLEIPPKNNTYHAPLATLIEKVLSIATPNLPGSIANLSISYLFIDYSHSKSDSSATNSYTLKGALSDNWILDGTELSATVAVNIFHQVADTKNNKKQNFKKEVSADFSMDGFDFTLSCDLTNTSEEISASISDEMDGQSLAMNGTYTEDKTAQPPNRKIVFTITSLPNLGTLMAWFVKKVTGDPFFTLPNPWFDLLNDINFDDILSDLSFEVEITPPHGAIKSTQKTVSCTLKPPAGHNSLFGVTVDSITLGYDSSARTKGRSGLSFKIAYSGYLPFISMNPIEWDPVNEQPPAVPGKSAPLDIELLALGQHATFNASAFPTTGPVEYTIPPTNVEQAITDLQFAISSLSGTSTPAMQFSKDGGWLIGAHAKFLGQADVQLLFDDPEMYGLRVVVNSSGNKPPKEPTTLDKFAGLYAEILYRKVSATVGEYEGFLTLPSKIRKMQFGNAMITLPSISVSIYTNGDFSFNIGFPYNLDFSHSVSVTAEGFTGSGGFYFAKLNGLHPKALPKAINGNFNPITEVGVGLRVGRSLSFHSGPLSASASLMLEALFQGIFAKFTTTSGEEEAEYYDIQAAIEIIGHIHGEINFAIVRASLSVTAFLRADAVLIACQPCHATLTASIEARVTVSIDLGLFSIHIHCHFSTTFQTHVTIGNSSPALWELDTSFQAEDADMMLFMGAPSAMDSNELVVWQPLTSTSPWTLNVDVVPQPTATGANDWHYVCQFAMNLDDGSKSYKHFVNGLLVWALNAITKPASGKSYDSVYGSSTSSTPITLDQVKSFTKALNNNSINTDSSSKNYNPYNFDSVAPTIADLQELFSSASGTGLFNIVIKEATKPSGKYKAAFFPALPGTLVQLVTSSGASELTDCSEEQATLFVEFIMLTISNALNKAEELGAFTLDHSTKKYTSTVFKIISTLEATPPVGSSQTYYESIAGLSTRFMLHGVRYKDSALYSATGQQQSFKADPKESITMKIHWKNAGSAWGTNLQPLSLQSGTPNQKTLIKNPSAFIGPSAPTLNLSEFTEISYLPSTHPSENKQYQIKAGIDTNLTNPVQSLWHLPKSLIDDLSSRKVDPELCGLMDATIDPKTRVVDGKPASAPLSHYATVIDFTIKKIPLPAGKGKKAAYMDNSYQLGAVNQLGLLRLEQLIQEIPIADPIYNLHLSYVNDQKATLSSIDGVNIFMLQSNFPTENASQSTPAQIYSDFVFKLWTGGVTSSSGYYLHFAGDTKPPDELFDKDGVAEISLVIKLTHLKPYTTGVFVNATANTYTGKTRTKNLFLENSGQQIVRSYFNPGKVPIRVSRKVRPTQDPALFPDLLNNLYNLLQVNCNDSNQGTALSPKNAPQTEPNTWYYDHVFSPIPEFVPDGSGIVPEQMNPYQFIVNGMVPVLNPDKGSGLKLPIPSGSQPKLPINLSSVDLYGNVWTVPVTPSKVKTPAPLYTDPLFSIKQLPHLHLHYSFNEQGAISIGFSFEFNGYADNQPGKIPLDHQMPDLHAYAKAIYQLTDSVSATVSSSFASIVDSSNVLSGIQENLKAIYKALDTNTPLSTSLPSILVAVTSTSINSEKFFPLNVSLTLKRTKLIDPAYAGDSSVVQSVMIIPPKSLVEKAKQTDAHYRNDLKPFATSFENAYASDHMKISVGAIDRKGTDPNAHQVWVVRYGSLKNIDVSFAQESGNPVYYCYSPRPLSNKLLSKDNVPVTISGTKSTITATNVDLDAEMRAFLSALDRLFTPEMMVAAAMINPDAISSLTEYKKAIVSKLTNYITYSPELGSGVSAALEAAKELYTEECLKELSNFYKMDAVTVLETNSNNEFIGSLNFLGTVVPHAETGKSSAEVTLSTGKAKVSSSAGQSYMAFGVFPKQLSKLSSYNADLKFKLTALEHDIEEIQISEGGSSTSIKAGAWFKFVNPALPIPVGPVKVPIPLRAFPTPPRPGRLYAEDLANTDTHVTNQNEELMYAKAWSLNGDYSHNYVAQDSIGLEVFMNNDAQNMVHHETSADHKSSPPDLFDALIQFRTIYPSLKGTLDTLSTIKNPNSSLTTVSDAIQQFATLVMNIANNGWTTPTASNSKSGIKNFFKITELKDTESNDWQATIESFDGTNSLGFVPQLRIPGYTSQVLGTPADPAKSVTYKFIAVTDPPVSPESIESRSVVVAPAESLIPQWPFPVSSKCQPFNILTYQDGIMTLKVMRNMDLASDFHYETSDVSYKSVLYPLLSTDAIINIGGISDKKIKGTTIANQLTRFFNELLMNYSKDVTESNGQFQIVVTFNFPSNSGPAFIQPVSVPVLMRINTDFNSTKYINDIEQAILSWVNKNYSSWKAFKAEPNIATAFFKFNVSLFSGSSNSGNPILRIENAQLMCSDITYPNPKSNKKNQNGGSTDTGLK